MSESIDVVVHSARSEHGPVVTSVLAVEELAGGIEAVQFTTTELLTRDGDGQLCWTGLVSPRLASSLGERGVDLRSLLDGSAAQPRQPGPFRRSA